MDSEISGWSEINETDERIKRVEPAVPAPEPIHPQAAGPQPDFDDEPLAVDVTLDQIEGLTPLQRYVAELWGQVATDANADFQGDNVATTIAATNNLKALTAALQSRSGLSEDEADVWVSAAFGANPDKLDRSLSYYNDADKKADMAEVFDRLVTLTERGNIATINTQIAGYIAIVRHSLGAKELLGTAAHILKSDGADDKGIDRVNEMTAGLDHPNLNRDTVVAFAYDAKIEPKLPPTSGPAFG